MTYQGWQIDNKDDTLSSLVQRHINKHGKPPVIIEHSQFQDVVLPEGMQIVTKAVRIPKNILLFGVYDDVSEE